MGGILDPLANLESRVELLAGFLVLDQFDAAKQPDATGVTDQGMVHECMAPVEERARYFANPPDQIHLLVDVQGLQCNRRSNRVPGVGEAVPEYANRIGVVHHVLIEVLPEHQRRHWKKRCGQCLRTGNGIGLQIEGLGTPPVTGSPESTDDFIDVKVDTVFSDDRLHLVPVSTGWQDCTATALHRFRHEGGDTVGSGLKHQAFEFLRHSRGKFRLAFAVLMKAVVVRGGQLEKIVHRQAETLVHVRLAGQADRSHRIAVIPLPSGNQLSAIRLSAPDVPIPEELDHRIVRFRPGALEHDPIHRHRRHAHQSSGEPGHLGVGAAIECRRERQGVHLPFGRFGETVVLIAE